MVAKRLGRSWMSGLTVAAFGLGTLVAHAPDARADDIKGTPKGMVGGGFLGAEVVAIPMAIAGVKAGWAYAVFPALGAAGGVVGGYFMDHAYDTSGPPQSPAYGSAFMLAGGMALIIPTIVLILNATRYHPAAGAVEDRAPKNVGPEANPGAAGGSSVAPASKDSGAGGAGQPPYVPLSLVDVHDGTLRLGLPVPEVHEAYTLKEVKELGVVQTTEVRVPVFKLAF